MSKRTTPTDRARASKSAAVVDTEIAAEPANTLDTVTPTVTEGLKIMMNTETLVAFNKGNLEAFTKASQIWATGVQTLTKQAAATAKTSFEESVATFKTLSTMKSVKDVIELQTKFARTAFETAVAETNKIASASIKLTEETLAPIAARVTAATETFGKAA